MQFVRNGPDIPERLVQAHEDGRVVFFCGAGISYPAGLPGFDGLVKKLYQALGVTPNSVQQSAIKAKQFDTAIGLLEADIVGDRKAVRHAIAKILTPNFTIPNATATHEALLTLARNSKGCIRLITTNFDRLFEHVKESESLLIPSYQAPQLPVPKIRWDGLIYLHGLLPATPTSNDLDRLVISSGDFGLAYLTERWAARFVSELFRNYVVCFVGYSINDPVLRYMMDALAADRLLGESPPEMFAFRSFSKGKEEACANEWKAKNVTPILYREYRHHFFLHKTLSVWAETYRDGVLGKERIVVMHGNSLPLKSTKQDDFVGRMLWALSDQSGLPAQKFAELDPVPPLEWLEPLSQGNVMDHLGRWLIRHLNDPKLLLWLIKQGSHFHDKLIVLITNRLDELDKFESDGKTDELACIHANAPNAIPCSAMRTLWRLLLTRCVESNADNHHLYRWRKHFSLDGLTPSIRLALREMLTPRVRLRCSDQKNGTRKSESISDFVRWEIVLAQDFSKSTLSSISKGEHWKAALPELIDDFSILLRDALDLMRELGGANDKSDLSYISRPSISEHEQNEYSADWTVLIGLTRDAWSATAVQSPQRARIVAEAWANTPYPLFRRLAFFAAAQGETIPPRLALDWLLIDEQWWSVETKRETIRLLVALAPRLDGAMLTKLEHAILSGPPRTMYRDGLEPNDWQRIVDHKIWLSLAKLEQAGAVLSDNGKNRLSTLAKQYPTWQLAKNESDEFPFWRGEEWIGDYAPWKQSISVPHTRRGIHDYLLAHPELKESEQDDWQARCSEHFQATAYALCKLAQQNNWPVKRWRDALQVWARKELLDSSWQYMAPILVRIPDDLLQSLANDISWWLQSVAETFQDHETHFLALIQRVMQLDFKDSSNIDDPVFHAINHPIGHVTQALLYWWYRQDLEDGQRLPKTIEPIFSEICNVQIYKFRHGRSLLATHVITLFRVDRIWAEQYLLPLFNWQCSEIEALTVWTSFLLSPSLYRPLLEELKPFFLDTANHYAKLPGRYNKPYASLLTYAALDPRDTFTTKQLANAIDALPADGLHKVAQTLVRALKSTGDKREDYWKNRVQPFWEKIWPKSQSRVSDSHSEALALLCIAAGEEFPSAMKTIKNWLRSIQNPYYVICQLQKSKLSARFPEHVLQLLDTILPDHPHWLPSKELQQILKAIALVKPDLRRDPRFMRAEKLAQQSKT